MSATAQLFRQNGEAMTVEELLEAERTLDGEALVAAQVEYLRTSDRWFPGAMHDEDECTVCDSRREAIRRWYDEEPDDA